MRFTKEQLIAKAREQIAFCRHTKITGESRTHVNQCSALFEIALSVLTAPDYIPPHVQDAMSDMCDGGFDGQGIWDLCRESIMPPAPCPRCGTVSDRPDGGHYCHVGANGGLHG